MLANGKTDKAFVKTNKNKNKFHYYFKIIFLVLSHRMV